jgi:hypothetical protein
MNALEMNERDERCYREEKGGRMMVVEKKESVFLNRRSNPQSQISESSKFT